MSHVYTCEKCKKVKKCNITGCRGDCINLCVKCAREEKYTKDYMKLCDLILKKEKV